MAITAQLVFVGHNRIRYLLSQNGVAGTALSITTTGGATPDLRTNSVRGPIKNLARAVPDGFGSFPPGALTAAQAAALWLSDRSNADPGNNIPAGQVQTPTAICRLTPLSGVGPGWTVSTTVAAGEPVVAVTSQAAVGTCYLDVEVLGAIGA